MKILLAVPTFENIEPETFKSIYGLNPCEHTVLFDFVRGYDCAKARNEIAREAIEGEYDAVLMVDSDTILPSDALAHLTDPVADICLAIYPRKGTICGQTELFRLGYTNFNEQNNILISTLDQYDGDRFEIMGGGMGCALIRTSVLKAIPFPWFSYITYPDGSVLSEDLDFCCKATQAGFKIYADKRVRCGHIGKRTQYE